MKLRICSEIVPKVPSYVQLQVVVIVNREKFCLGNEIFHRLNVN